MRAHEFTDQGAAGIILYAEDTGRYGLQQRSDSINDGGLWAAWGGGREPGESLEQCARRELAEESGYTGPIKLKRLAENARYVTFIGVVPHEFEPRPDPEWKDYCWVEAGDWPGPMHPGVAAALKNIPVNENFADGKVKGKSRPGRVKRAGASCSGSVSSLRAKAKKYGGERGRMYHWCANMKGGKKKANEEYYDGKNFYGAQIGEDIIGHLHFPNITIAVDDHAIERTQTHGVNPRAIDTVLKKLSSIANDLNQLEVNNKVWVYDPASNIALGLRRISSREPLFKLKTVVGDKPYDGQTPIINL